VEDFVDEDTGEVVSIERNEIIIDRETVLEEHHIQEIIDSGTQAILLHRPEANQNDYAIIYNTLQKDPSNSEKEAVLYIYRQLRNAVPADDSTAREVINKFVLFRKTIRFGRCRTFPYQPEIEPEHQSRHQGFDKRRHYRNYQVSDRVD